jgi:hypothetical protein
MARRDIEMFDLIELYTHWQAGRLSGGIQGEYQGWWSGVDGEQ